MEIFNPACPWHIQVGDLFIAPGHMPNSGTVWIGEIEGAEGGEFKTAELSEVLRDYYAKNF